MKDDIVTRLMKADPRHAQIVQMRVIAALQKMSDEMMKDAPPNVIAAYRAIASNPELLMGINSIWLGPIESFLDEVEAGADFDPALLRGPFLSKPNWDHPSGGPWVCGVNERGIPVWI